MSQRLKSSDKQTMKLVEKCLVVVLKEKKSKKNEDSNSKVPPLTGSVLFEQFIDENRECYWNPHLEESINNVKYFGFLQPHCLLIGGRDIYIETIKAAWSRRVLRAPGKFVINKVGYLEDVNMNVIAQTQFTPLPEVLCLIISQLNRQAQSASLEAILQELGHRYHGMQQPSEHLVYQALGSLCSEANIYHTGSGYHIVKPHMDHLNGCPLKGWNNNMPANGTAGTGVPLGSPQVPSPGEVCSVSCQTEQPKETEEKLYDELQKTISEGDPEDNLYDKPGPAVSTGRRFQRSLSLRGSKKSERASSLQRTGSLRPGAEKSGTLIKDINLKTSDVHRDKDKGEKQSVLKKLFGRNKHESKKSRSKDSSNDTSYSPGSIEQDQSNATSSPKQEVELATFSAQFPPPEWEWYEQQQQPQPAATEQQLAKSQTWHGHMRYTGPHLQGCAYSPTEGPWADERYLRAQMTHSLPLGHTPQFHQQIQSKQAYYTSSSDDSYTLKPLDGAKGHRASSPPAPSHRRSSSKHRSSSRGQTRSLSARRREELEVRELDQDSNNLYCEPEFQQPGVDSYWEQHNPHQDLPNASGKPSLPPPRTHHHQHKEHKTHHKKRHLPSGSFNYNGNDISIEYHGHMPRRNSGYSMSRDSGVNCVGLAEAPANDRTPTNHGANMVLNNTRQMRPKHPQATSTPRDNNMVTHQATVHERGKMPSHQDSGFVSPRTEPEKSQGGPTLPNTNSRSFSPHTIQSNHNLTKADTSTRHKSKRASSSGFKQKRNLFLSNDSLEITGSEFYPSYHGGIIPDQDNQNQDSGTISTSSTNQTVLEKPGYNEKQHQQHAKTHHMTTEINGNIDHYDANGCRMNKFPSEGTNPGKDTGRPNNNVNMKLLNNLTTVPSKDAYKPRLYSCCSNGDGCVDGLHDHRPVTGQRDLNKGSLQQLHPHDFLRNQEHKQPSKADRSSFLDNCQVVGVL